VQRGEYNSLRSARGRFDIEAFAEELAVVKRIAVVPTLLTLGNGICGFVAITFASKIGMASPDAASQDEAHFVWAGWFILFAMLFDMLDGYVARLSRTASDFGGELDSLCDAISFGVAPAFLVLKLGPGWEPSAFLHQLLAGIAALYLACTVLRLARFNVENSPESTSHKRFRGLPSPGAAGCIASLAILRGDFANKLVAYWHAERDLAHTMTTRLVEIVSPIGALLVALLMVSNVPYPHVTGKVFAGRKHIGHLIQLLLAVFVISMTRELAPVLIFWIYALFFPARYLMVRGTRRGRVVAAASIPPEAQEPTQH
jgi:CDP-diacylglycerol--serine O-phosphatidyltransferase